MSILKERHTHRAGCGIPAGCTRLVEKGLAVAVSRDL